MPFRVLALFGFFVVVSTVVGALAGIFINWLFRLGMPGLVLFFATLFFLVSVVMSIAYHSRSYKSILRKYKAKPSENEELNDMVDKLAINAKIPTPKVYILPIDIPNSFATGRSQEKACICVTEGLLKLNKGEIESVIAHEIWHIANNDILIQDAAAVVANTFRWTFILSPLAVFVVKLALSGSREYRADYYGSRFSKKAGELASALRKINEIVLHNPMGGSPAFEPLWIINPYKRDGFPGMFSTHPPTARRVKRVEDMEHEGIPEPPEATEVD